ncbi:uncharacterized protein J3D65DRAFT_195336 [Phyllosticta citribraziliensis]|uniref:Uncharacterized protein n=1 Tax=Phyllosticta citribraziliensis TaxID=989973 RepID=A0ABR1M335_9PEZI
MIAEKKLHWTQRVALIRHNLHAASRTGDFTFFKTLQAHRLLEGTDHLAALTDAIGDAADQVLASLDNYNSVMAYVHEDAFKNVYESVKTGVREQNGNYEDRRAIYYVDSAQQKEKAEKAIDKMINSAITMINAQPMHSQEEAANVWIWGTTFVADAMEVCLAQIDQIECYLDDFIRLENSWSTVQAAVGASIGAIKGIFNLMAPSEAPSEAQQRSEQTEGTVRSMLRRMSTAMTSGINSAPGRRQSVLSVASNNNSSSNINSNISTNPNMVPPSLPHGSIQPPHLPKNLFKPSSLRHSGGSFEPMATIPPTPAAAMLNTNLFETSLSRYAMSSDLDMTVIPGSQLTSTRPASSVDQNFSVGEDVPPIPTNFRSNTSTSSMATPAMTVTASSNVPRTFSPPTDPASAPSGSPSSGNRPRSSNVSDPRPPFDDMLFM